MTNCQALSNLSRDMRQPRIYGLHAIFFNGRHLPNKTGEFNEQHNIYIYVIKKLTINYN